MERPLIGVVGNLLVAEGGFSPGLERNYVNNDYVSAVERAGGIPVVLPVARGQDIAEAQVSCVRGLVVPGGLVRPPAYGPIPPESFILRH